LVHGSRPSTYVRFHRFERLPMEPVQLETSFSSSRATVKEDRGTHPTRVATPVNVESLSSCLLDNSSLLPKPDAELPGLHAAVH
jgi:hypothetical protein